jgi:hypothetical protein
MCLQDAGPDRTCLKEKKIVLANNSAGDPAITSSRGLGVQIMLEEILIGE